MEIKCPSYSLSVKVGSVSTCGIISIHFNMDLIWIKINQ